MKAKKYILLLTLLILMLMVTTSAYAQRRRGAPPPPYATMNIRWTPEEQLVSITADPRDVTMSMSVSTDRQFWAMDISCLVTPINEVNQSIDIDVFEASSTVQTMQWDPGVTEGASAVIGENHFDSTQDSDAGDTGIQYYDATTNRINATVTRVGASNQPIGMNGVNYTQTLFNLRLRIVEDLTGVAKINLTCDKVSLLNRDGESVGDAGKVVATNYENTLLLRAGYVIRGSAIRQATDFKEDIQVTCTNQTSSNTYVTDTEYILILGRRGVIISEIAGLFTFENAFGSDTDPLREFGLYKCVYMSNMDGDDDPIFLQGVTYINLQTPEYTIQPVVLPAGDTDSDNTIDANDFVAITTNWQSTVTAFENGDVNGDGMTNEVDLSITAGNVDLSDSPNEVMLDHVLYSAARDYNGEFPNNTMAMGGRLSGQVNPLSDLRTFWPNVSPDGSQVAYFTKGFVTIRVGRRGSAQVLQQGLAVSPLDTFASTTLIEGLNFAPLWSPSGGQIAYICTWETESNSQGIIGYEYNNGNLCITSATGGTSQTIIPPGAASTYAEIFPPAWYDESTLVYAGNEDHPTCPDQLCYYDFLTGVHDILTVDGIEGSTNKANMPIIIRHYSGVNFLFYRQFTTSTSEIRMGTLVYDSASNSWSGGAIDSVVSSDELHELVDGTTGGVSYFDVSPMLDVMFYEFGDTQFTNVYFEDLNPGPGYEWNQEDKHLIDGFIGYPMTDLDTAIIWNGDELSGFGTDFHAYKATFDWIP